MIDILIDILEFGYVISDKLIKIENDIKDILFAIDSLQESSTLVKLLKLIIKIVTLSNEYEINDIFYIIAHHKRNLMERFYLLFKNTDDDEVRMYMGNLFILLSISKECWEIMLHVSYYLCKFLLIILNYIREMLFILLKLIFSIQLACTCRQRISTIVI